MSFRLVLRTRLRPRSTLVFLLLTAVLPSPALAGPSEIVVSAGALAMSPDPMIHDFVAVALDGTSRSITSPMEPFTLTDARGSGAGWKIIVQGSRFREWDGTAYVSDGRTLPAGSLAMPAPAVEPQATDSPSPVLAPGPYGIDGYTITIASAATGTGMGAYGFTPAYLVLTVPASAFAVTYRSEVAITVASGP